MIGDTQSTLPADREQSGLVTGHHVPARGFLRVPRMLVCSHRHGLLLSNCARPSPVPLPSPPRCPEQPGLLRASLCVSLSPSSSSAALRD